MLRSDCVLNSKGKVYPVGSDRKERKEWREPVDGSFPCWQMFDIIRPMYSLNEADRFGRDIGKLLPFAIDGCRSLNLN
jgi:hypothetical protein